MGPKRPASSSSNESVAKYHRKALTLETKLEILRRADAGEGNSALGRVFGVGESTIRSIKANAVKIRASVIQSTSLSAKITTRVRNPVVEKMEKMLSLYIERETKVKHSKISNGILRSKALHFYQRVVENDNIKDPEPFVASQGWLDKFIRRQNLHNIVSCGESASADHDAAAKFPEELRAIVHEMGYSPKQIFNADETGLFWKRMTNRTYISKEEKCSPGFKPFKDRITLLLCGNAAGDFKLKPAAVYHAQNPRALKGVSKQTMPVHWYANKKGWMTAYIFEDWLLKHFSVEAERYCKRENLDFRVLLILDNAPSHPKHLDSLSPNIQVIFLPPNTTSVLQPMDQGVIATFKAKYTRKTMNQMLEATDDFDNPGSKPTITQWWKTYNIKMAIGNMDEAWDEISSKAMNASWKNALSEFVNDFTGFPKISDTIKSIVTIAHKVGGEGFADMKEEEVVELLDSHDEELTADDLLELTTSVDESRNDDDDDDDDNMEIKDLSLKKLSELFSDTEALIQKFEHFDPNFQRSLKIKRQMQEMLVPYKELYNQRKNVMKQSTMLNFFRPVSTTPEPETSASSSRNISQPGHSSSSSNLSHSSLDVTLPFPEMESDVDDPSPRTPTS